MGRKRHAGGDKDGATSKKYSFWPEKLDRPLVKCILELVEKGLIVNGNCKNGGYAALEKMLEQKVLDCGVRGRPHIEGRIKKLKKLAGCHIHEESKWMEVG
ncbi:unnamed protein product [Linum trigynum]|uniref:Uncharacterized protein n=1 Tax=Linum trigynum TaxID=586398 RepID=A0AAV2EZV6_9ROSI